MVQMFSASQTHPSCPCPGRGRDARRGAYLSHKVGSELQVLAVWIKVHRAEDLRTTQHRRHATPQISRHHATSAPRLLVPALVLCLCRLSQTRLSPLFHGASRRGMRTGRDRREKKHMKRVAPRAKPDTSTAEKTKRTARGSKQRLQGGRKQRQIPATLFDSAQGARRRCRCWAP